MGDWQERANKRRDERHTKVDDNAKKPSSKVKNTKKWCKGVVGKEHTTHTFRKKDQLNTLVLCCKTCGKEFDVWWDSEFERKFRIMPQWVKDFLGVENDDT